MSISAFLTSNYTRGRWYCKKQMCCTPAIHVALLYQPVTIVAGAATLGSMAYNACAASEPAQAGSSAVPAAGGMTGGPCRRPDALRELRLYKVGEVSQRIYCGACRTTQSSSARRRPR